MNGNENCAPCARHGRLSLAAVLMATTGVISAASAADITRATATGTLNLTTSWNGGSVPTAGDVAVWDNQSAIAGQLGADLSFGGIRIADPTAAVSINGANILTLGASGIDMSAALQNLTLQPGNTTVPASGITLGAAQSWNVGAGRQITAGNGASGITGTAAATLTKSGAGTVFFNTGLSTFAGGVTLNSGTITFNSNSVTASGVIGSGPLGTGTLTVNGGTIAVSTTSGRDQANDAVINNDFSVGATGTNRVRFAGTWNLGNATRTVTLNTVGTGVNNGTETFGMIIQGGKTFTVANGNLRFAAAPTATPTTPSVIAFAASGGSLFTNNSGLTIGANVLGVLGSSQTASGTNSPALTIEAGGAMLLANNVQAKNLTVNSLSGAGTIGTAQVDGSIPVANLTIDGSTGSTTFSGKIVDIYNVFGSAYTGASLNLIKNNPSTQVLSGTNTYSGTTVVSGGTLVVATPAAIAPTSVVTVGGGANAAVYKLGFGPAVARPTIALPTIGANGKLDVGTGGALLTGTSVAAVQALVNAGIANTSPAIITSSADGSHNVGYGDIGEGGVTVRYTLLGDADLNGQVNFNDFLTLQNNFSQSGVFNQGDFTYDGVVNFNDFLALQNNFGQSVTGAPVTFTSAQVAAITAFAATVPEPASLAVLGLAGIGLIRRRRTAA